MRFVQRKLYEGRGFKAMLLTLLCRRSLMPWSCSSRFEGHDLVQVKLNDLEQCSFVMYLGLSRIIQTSTK